jgi:hypothetical protein
LVDGVNSGSYLTKVYLLSLYDNQLLVGSEVMLYIYNTNGSFLSAIYLSDTLQQDSHYLQDAAWISRDQILYTTRTGIYLITLPSRNITRLYQTASILRGISVSDGVIYVCTITGGVLASSDGGITWFDMLWITLGRQYRESVHVIRVPEFNSTHTEVFWAHDTFKADVGLVPVKDNDDMRVLVCVRSVKISTSCHEVIRVNKTLTRLAYDGHSAVLLTDSAATVIHVFDVSGRYDGQLKLLGAKLTFRPTSLAAANGVLYIGMDDGSVMVFKLVRLPYNN